MDLAVSWSAEAVEDLESIAEYIARDSAFYARAVVTRILDVARALPEFPLIGRIVPELNNEQLRERLVYSYRLIYHVEAERILIVAVIHGRQLIEDFSERFSGG